MNHFLDPEKQSNFELTSQLIAENPLASVKPFKALAKAKTAEAPQAKITSGMEASFNKIVQEEVESLPEVEQEP